MRAHVQHLRCLPLALENIRGWHLIQIKPATPFLFHERFLQIRIGFLKSGARVILAVTTTDRPPSKQSTRIARRTSHHPSLPSPLSYHTEADDARAPALQANRKHAINKQKANIVILLGYTRDQTYSNTKMFRGKKECSDCYRLLACWSVIICRCADSVPPLYISQLIINVNNYPESNYHIPV